MLWTGTWPHRFWVHIPLLYWVATLGKLFTHNCLPTPVFSTSRNWGVRKGSFRLGCLRHDHSARPDSTQFNWLASFCQFLSILNISVELSWVESSCRSDHSARSDSTGRSRLAVSCDPVFCPDVIIALLITTNEVNNVIDCRSLSR